MRVIFTMTPLMDWVLTNLKMVVFTKGIDERWVPKTGYGELEMASRRKSIQEISNMGQISGLGKYQTFKWACFILVDLKISAFLWCRNKHLENRSNKVRSKLP